MKEERNEQKSKQQTYEIQMFIDYTSPHGECHNSNSFDSFVSEIRIFSNPIDC